jgi:plasmid rolling circle replication initiator protein Rep
MNILKNQECAEKLERYEEKKRNSMKINKLLSSYYVKLGKNSRSEQIEKCASYLMFRNYQNPDKTKKLLAASFCKHPLCVMCEWRLHLKKVLELETAIKLMRKADSAYKFYFLTLTVKNWPEITNSKLKDLQKKAVRFIRDVVNSNSYYVSTEITISKNGDYHPHIHAIVSTEHEVEVNYNLISAYRRLWCLFYEQQDSKFLEVAYYPIAKNNIHEVTKYVLKPEKKLEQKSLINVAVAIHNLRKTFASGDLRNYIKQAKAKIKSDVSKENSLLIGYRYYDELFNWLNNKYLLKAL